MRRVGLQLIRKDPLRWKELPELIRLAADVDARMSFPPILSIPGQLFVTPSNDTTGATDPVTIGAALSKSQGIGVTLSPGIFHTNVPIQPPNWTTLQGSGQVCNNSFLPASEGGDQYVTTLAPVAGFTSSLEATGVIVLQGSPSTPIGGQTIRRLYIDNSSAPASVDGISAWSNVYGVSLDEVATRNVTGVGLNLLYDGTSGEPDGWRINRVMIDNCTGLGMFVQAGDLIVNDLHVIGGSSDGIAIRTSPNSLFSNCRATNTSGNGWNLGDSATGGASPNGSLQLVNCLSQDNHLDGLHIQWPSAGGQGVRIVGFVALNDGQAGGTTYGGVRITGGATASLTSITGLWVYANGTGPYYGFYSNASGSVTLVDAFVNGLTVATDFVSAVTYRALWTATGSGASSGWTLQSDSA